MKLLLKGSRFTAKDPLGYAAEDDDLYGYCFDDPVNLADPFGLESGFWGGVKKIGAGFEELWDKAPGGVAEAVTKGAKGAGQAVERLGHEYATNKDLQKYTGIALEAGLAPVAVAATPEIAATAAPYAGRIAQGAGAVASAAKSKVTDAATTATGAVIRNQDKVNKAADVAMDIANPVPPAKTSLGQIANAGLMGYDQHSRKQNQKKINGTKKTQTKVQDRTNSWWGR